MFISINKKIISTTLILLFFLFSGINTQNNVSAQMPPTGGDFLFEESTCRNNPGTGEVFCELTLDTSSYIMTQTVAPKEYYEGQGVWFQGCRVPGQQHDNYDAAWIERHYVAEAGSIGTWGQSVTNFYNLDPKAKVTHIYFRGNVQQEPGRQIIQCKYQFFTVDSPLVKPGQPYHNPQWEADMETQRMYEEADRIRREADRARAEEELLRAKQQAELELQLQEEERKRQEKENQQIGIQDLFGQGPVGNVGNIFSNAFQPPPDEEVPQGPFINLTAIAELDRVEIMDCIASNVEEITGMSYEQAYMDFAFPIGVRMMDEPDFYYDAVTNCMHLSYDKLLSGAWGVSSEINGMSGGKAPRDEINVLLNMCVVPHLADTLKISNGIIMDDVVTVESGKRSVTREEMLAAYDCFIHHEQIGYFERNFDKNITVNHYPNGQDLLINFIFGDEEIPGQNCMIESLSSREFDLGMSKEIIYDLVDFAIGQKDEWDFLLEDNSDEHKNFVVNTAIGCNNDLAWLRDYQISLTAADGPNLADIFARLVEPEFRNCISDKFMDYGGLTNEEASRAYDQMLMGFMDHEDPTEYTNRPLGEAQFSSIVDCASEFEVDYETQLLIEPYLVQYTHFIEEVNLGVNVQTNGLNRDEKYDAISECIIDTWTNPNAEWKAQSDLQADPDDDAEHLVWTIFYSGGELNSSKPLKVVNTPTGSVEVPTRDYTSDELRVVYECLDAQQQFEWIDNYYNDGFNYEPLFESDLFTQTNVDFESSAADFRQTISSNNSEQANSNMVSGSQILGEPLEMERLEAVNLARGASAEDCMVANLAREKGETENYIRSSYIANLIWEPTQRPSKNEREVLQNCESQIRSATQGLGGLELLLRFGSYGDPDYLSEPSDSQRACMVNEYKNDFGYMIESYGGNPTESATKAISEISLPGTYNGYHPILGDVPNVRPPASKELNAISNCRVEDLFVYEGSRLRKLIPGVDTSNLPIGELVNNPSNLAIMGIIITLFFSVLQMVRGK